MSLSFRGYIFRLTAVVILVFLIFEFVVFITVTRKKDADDKKYIRDYEKLLCSYSKHRKKYDFEKGECPHQGIVTTFRQGALANNLWQYTNVIAASVATGLDPYIPHCMREALEEAFDNITVPLLSEIHHCRFPLFDTVVKLEDWTDVSQSIVITSRDLYGDLAIQSLALVREQLVFNTIMKDDARFHLEAATPKGATNVTFVGVYITQTSIIVSQEKDDVYPTVQFFVDAMTLFRRDYPDAVFIVITDRKTFWEYIFGKTNVYVVDEDDLISGDASLALLSHCNHTILASDGLAVWGAILSGGRTIISLSLSEDYSNLMQYRRDWNYLINDTKTLKKFLKRLF